MTKKYDIEKLKEVIKKSYSIAEVIREMNNVASISGGNYSTVKKYIKLYNIDTSHFRGQGWLKGQTHNFSKKIDLENILVENSPYQRGSLKRRLLKNEMLTYHCYECKTIEWNNKPLSLHLDHINGVNDDHRIENLRLLCPNCHSQTDTFAGRNIGKYKETNFVKKLTAKSIKKTNSILEPKERKSRTKKEYFCSCGKKIFRKSTRCKKCFILHDKTIPRKTKIVWPTPEEMQKMIWEKPTIHLSKEMGVSDVAIAKFCKKYSILKPPTGYWLRK